MNITNYCPLKVFENRIQEKVDQGHLIGLYFRAKSKYWTRDNLGRVTFSGFTIFFKQAVFIERAILLKHKRCNGA